MNMLTPNLNTLSRSVNGDQLEPSENIQEVAEQPGCINCSHIRHVSSVASYCGSGRHDLDPAYGEHHPLRKIPQNGGVGCANYLADGWTRVVAQKPAPGSSIEATSAWLDKTFSSHQPVAQHSNGESLDIRIQQAELGLTVVGNLRNPDKKFINWAASRGLLVKIDRTSDWGNPFAMRSESQRDQVCDAYADHLANQPQLIARLPELKGKVLACWCYPKRCHGDHLAQLVNKGKS